jgi:uncharacterized protein (DUF488 family)
MKLMTCGYEGAQVAQFFSTLQSHQIEMIIDLRELPLSRKPGFSKSALMTSASRYHLDYVHIPALGCPREIRHAYRKDKNWARYTQRFLAYLRTQDQALAELAGLVKRERCCLLCFEADPSFCHRSYVAEHLAIRLGTKLSIVHLQIPTSTQVARCAHASSAGLV